MMATEILMWMCCFSLLVILQALLINGIHASMAGETEIMPNGKHKDSEMILYPFMKWLTSKLEPKKVFFEGARFRELADQLYVVYSKIMPGEFDPAMVSSYIELKTDEQVTQMAGVSLIIRRELNIFTEVSGRHIRFYKEYDNYRFSKWVRKPLGQCIKCMASVYTVIPFWAIALSVFGFQWWLIPLYVANVFIVSHLAYLMYRK